MAKGFKDSKGKFRPTEKKSGLSKKDIESINEINENADNFRLAQKLKQKGRDKVIRVFKFEDLEPNVQEQVIENERQKIGEFGDTFFAEDQGLIFDNDEKKDADDIGLSNPTPKFFDVDSNRGTDFIQFELEVESKDRFAKYLGIDPVLQNKIHFGILNDSDRDPDNTSLEITVPSGEIFGTDSAMDDFSGILNKPEGTFEDISEKEFEKILDAILKFDRLMSMALTHLTNNYEDQFTDERIKEDLEANEREFEMDGSSA